MRGLFLISLFLFFVNCFHLQCITATNTVTDGHTSERDNESTAKVAIIVTSVACGLAAFLCIGACAYCCYQKCCIDGFSI